MHTERVLKVTVDSPFKTLKLTHRKSITISQWACVGEGDEVFKRNGKNYVRCINGEAQFTPPYDQLDVLGIGARKLPVHVKEITTIDEFEAYQYLQSFHYRGNGGFGRKSILVVVPDETLMPRILGYARLNSSFIVNKPRDDVLDGQFNDGSISWEKWDRQSRQKHVNCIVRIGRVVVHPEFRGLGLGKTLVRHALAFAQKHWQIARVKPLFGEMTADMLKYIPFAERAGMNFVGFTQGNLRRVERDLRYMIRGRHLTTAKKLRGAEIPDMQTAYASKTLAILKVNGLNLETFLSKFNFRANKTLGPRAYSLVHDVIRFPKPTLMKGLTSKADRFLEMQLEKLGPIRSDSKKKGDIRVQPISLPIRMQNVTLSFGTSVPKTQRSCAVQEAFGISPTQLETTVFRSLDLEILPGEILLVSGCSGSGKTAFLDLLTRRIRPSNHPDGKISLPPNARIGLFRPIPNDKPLIEYREIFGENIARAIYVLNKAGLSEAFLYLRRYSELSEGQKYRAMIARLLNSKSNIWLADDFLSTLDPITANIVAHNVREFAKSSGVTLIAAAPHYESFIHALRPDKVLLKSYGWKWNLFDGSGFPGFAKKSAARLTPFADIN